MSAAIVAIAVAVLFAHAWRYYPFFADDALISLRYSVRFVNGLGLTWTDGETVEGYSNPLWVLACSLFIKAGIEPILAARLLGLGCGAGAVITIARAHDGVPGAVAAIAAGLCGPLAVWSMGGLEQPMVAFFLALSLALLLPRLEEGALWPAGLALAALVMSRPDSPLFVAIAVLLVTRWRGVRAAAALGGPPVLAWLGWEAFRLVYYQDWLPNPAYAKLAPSWDRFGQGLEWVGLGAVWMAPLVVASFLAIRRWRSRRVILLAALALGWHLYVAWIGGDIFPAHRHWVPSVVLHALLLAEGLTGVSRRVAAAVAALTLVPLGVLSWFDDANQRAADEVWEWQCADVAHTLGAGFRVERPLLGADPAGCLPYFSDLPSIDLFGLNDRWLAHHPPADVGSHWIGHGLGDGAYVFGRKPDLLVFCKPWGAERGCGRSGKELLAMPEFKKDYRMLIFAPRSVGALAVAEPAPNAKVWTRLAGPLGPRRDGDTWLIPGFWLAANGAVAQVGASGKMVAVVSRSATVNLGIPGEWSVVVDASGPVEGTIADGALRVIATDTVEVREIRLVPATGESD